MALMQELCVEAAISPGIMGEDHAQFCVSYQSLVKKKKLKGNYSMVAHAQTWGSGSTET